VNGGSFNLVERSGRAEQIQSSPVAFERFQSALAINFELWQLYPVT